LGTKGQHATSRPPKPIIYVTEELFLTQQSKLIGNLIEKFLSTPFELRYTMHYLDKSKGKIAEFRDYFVFASKRIVYEPKLTNEFLVNTPNTSYVPSCCSEEPLTNCRQLALISEDSVSY
jgi:hypothetical protein